MNLEKQQCCVLIPSLSPDGRLPVYVKALLEAGFGGVVVVNDGSAREYDPFFEECRAMTGCSVLGYEVNRGKGYALRTGIRHIAEHTDFSAIITADSDGQHTPEDTEKLVCAMDDSESIWLGSRDFTSPDSNIPKKSRFGNRVTSAVFKLFYGQYLPDTQTGLRAFARKYFEMMCEVDGDRFEYEMNVLMRCSAEKIAMRAVPIRTIYLEENKSTHFHPIRDSWRIYKLLLGNFISFMAVSLACWVLDNGIYHLMRHVILPEKERFEILFWQGAHALSVSILVSYFTARLISSFVNFLLNRDTVFRMRESRGAIGRYYILAACCLLISATVTATVDLYLPNIDWLIKLVVDLLMFFANYRIQRVWVFRKTK